jgi:hypothetical protein
MTCPLFVELCAGTAALSLRLHRRHARPPVSRMGAKTGYADAILRVLGLRPGQGAAHYLWCEPDPGVRLLLEAYRDANLAREAAAIIRGWVDEEPRALWERLRAEGPPRGVNPGDVGVPPREVARWVWTYGRSFNGTGTAYRPEESSKGTPVWNAHPPEHFADAMGDLPALPALRATITPDARRVDPREVARWAWVQRRTHPGNERSFLHQVPVKPVANPARQGLRWTHEQPAPLFEALPVIEATIVDTAGLIEPGPDLPPGTVAYMDPPYVGTTGYGHDLPRSEVVALARRWSAAGAMVAISEAEPIGDLVAEGWHAVRIDGERKGQARTFSKQKDEWLTLSNAPTWTPTTQGRLPF